MTSVDDLGWPAWDATPLLTAEAPQVAEALLGTHLVRRMSDDRLIVARIVETEAYRQDDPASHSFRGCTAANASMFAPAGTAYVYRSYGVHWCLNVAVEAQGSGAAVLIRAAVVVDGIDLVRRNRSGRADHELLRGPGNLTAGLDIDGHRHDGVALTATGSSLRLAAGTAPDTVQRGPRTGVRLGADVPWRFHLDVPEVSSYRRHPRARSTGHAT